MASDRKYDATPAVRGREPLSLGFVGPPGGGKTVSALRVATGIQSVNGGDIILIDTEAGRARKYADQFKFLHVNFEPPHRSSEFLAAIMQQVKRKPACIIVDSMSDEHEGVGGYLQYHDEQVPKMGNNEWAAWSKPSAERKELTRGMLHILTPMIFTFRAREKTRQTKDRNGKTVIENIGWMPVAPLEIVHNLDLTCLLPPRADGVAVWKSDKVGEDFTVKLPSFLQPFIKDGDTLSEAHGAAFARWANGDSSQRAAPAASVQGEGRSTVGEAPVDRPPAHMSVELFNEVDAELAEAALKGMKELEIVWKALHPMHQRALKTRKDKQHKPTAEQVDAKGR